MRAGKILPQRIFSEESSREILSKMLERAAGTFELTADPTPERPQD